MRDQADGCLECSKKHIDENADDACADNDLLAGFLIFNGNIAHIAHLKTGLNYNKMKKNIWGTLQTKDTVVKMKTDHSVPKPHRVCFGLQGPICIGR